MSTLAVQNLAGETIAEYPDFDKGQPVRVLPEIVSSVWPADSPNRMVQDNWTFVGPTRHHYACVVRESEYGTTVHMDRNRLVAR